MWGDDIVAYGLYDEVDQQAFAEHHPECVVAVEAHDEAYYCDGDECYVLEVGDHVEDAYGEAHDEGEWEFDDGESDAVEDAGAESDESLSAEVAVHCFFDVLDDGHCAVAEFFGENQFEASDYLVVIDEYEYDVDEHQRPFEDFEERFDRPGYDVGAFLDH